MKGKILLLGCAFFAYFTQAQTALDQSVVERGPHHDVIQNVDQDGNTNQFTLLQTGLNRWSEADKQFIPASPEVEVVNGVAMARKTQFQTIFGTTADDPDGAVDVLMPDGQ